MESFEGGDLTDGCGSFEVSAVELLEGSHNFLSTSGGGARVSFSTLFVEGNEDLPLKSSIERNNDADESTPFETPKVVPEVTKWVAHPLVFDKEVDESSNSFTVVALTSG